MDLDAINRRITAIENRAHINYSSISGVAYKVSFNGTTLSIESDGTFKANTVIVADTSEVTHETDDIYVSLEKWTHNESVDILLCVIANTTDSYDPTGRQITTEGTSNSPTDYYEYTSGVFTISNITDSSKYYSSINYETFLQLYTYKIQGRLLYRKRLINYSDNTCFP